VLEIFEGHSFHRSRRDFSVTAASASEDPTHLSDKIVGIVVTCATATQCIPARSVSTAALRLPAHPIAGSSATLVRDRNEAVVEDRQRRRHSSPGSLHVQRPTFHDWYLTTFNRPNVHLIDINDRGLREHPGPEGAPARRWQEKRRDACRT
jgi:hypothetical protein